MSYTLTAKSQVTVPKAIRQHLHVGPGQSVDYEPLPDGSVRMFAVAEVTPSVAEMRAALRQWRGKGLARQSTAEFLRETRGEDSMR